MIDATDLIRVLVVDDHDMIRRGLSMFLDGFDDLMIVGEAADGAEAIAQCEALQPDVVLMDLVMPGTDGLTATQVIRERFPHVQVVALTSSSDQEIVSKAMQSGAISYLMKNVSDEQLADAVRAAHHGSSTLAPEAAQALINFASRPPSPTYSLTKREIEILKYMIDGLSNPEIAQIVYLSRATVKYHIRNILAKLNAANRAEAVAIAVKNNLV